MQADRILTIHPLVRRSRLIAFLKCALHLAIPVDAFLKPAHSFGDPVSPLILSTPPHAIPVDHIS